MVYASWSGPLFLRFQISASKASLSASSASSDRIHSLHECSAAQFFCAAYPSQLASMTRTPSFSASSTVRSVEPLSTIRISSQQRRLSTARATLRSSLRVMMVAVIFMRSLAVTDRREHEAQQENGHGEPSQFLAAGAHRGGIHDDGMVF